jgi:hypothetical protein
VPYGIKAVRPSASGTAISIEFYVGTDKTSTVYFDATRDMMDDGNYLFSKKGSATAAYILGPNNAAKLNKSTTVPTGLDRRVILVDATTSGEASISVLQQQAEQSLTEASEIAMFDGAINIDTSQYKYNVHYGLGDIVRLVGDYGMDRKVQVTEYIRSEDNTGIKSYPTFAYVA